MNRRIFLKSAGLLVGGYCLSESAFAHLQADDHSSIIRGRVVAVSKGVQGVAVSDGYAIAVTDKNGDYQITTNPESAFLFICNPSGYEIEQDAGFAAIYRSLDQQHYTFHLRKSELDDLHHGFIGLGDPQVRVQDDVRQFQQESIPDMQQFIQLQTHRSFHGISVGDSIWDKPDMWQPYQEAVAQLGIPFFQTVGNHDKHESTQHQPDTAALFKMHCGPTYYSFNRGMAHYVVLDNVNYTSIKDYNGEISAEQLAWLAKDLALVPHDHLLILSVHIPVYNAVKNKQDLYALLAPFSNVHILSGHTHQNTNHIHQHIFEHTIASVCGAWWTGSVCTDGTPRGYAVFEVQGSTLSWCYKSIGKDTDYQFRTSVQRLNKGHRITVNVWNYDPEWKVQWYADGKLMGHMDQTKTLDPLARSLYEGPQLPADRRGWVEPRRTAHIFYTQTRAKQVQIVVTDRFGREFKEDVNLKETYAIS
ncbi:MULTISPECIES: calcineurin-like phosphoesterase C-terminal domain-containing protein [Sphingobacterium]|uniref:Calcineurin-like phosphoesterase C-terminal domain-containing protein n=1 Tax=Sphingobacterium populi TaxID=1812824 RepID=A0ABW5UCR6_9SPHI|nr:calcineurin-like phosphoesterase family protein [Sphingobacterium sp. CFCC 11742]